MGARATSWSSFLVVGALAGCGGKAAAPAPVSNQVTVDAVDAVATDGTPRSVECPPGLPARYAELREDEWEERGRPASPVGSAATRPSRRSVEVVRQPAEPDDEYDDVEEVIIEGDPITTGATDCDRTPIDD